MPALLTRTLFTRTPKQIISATLRYRGEGDATLQLVTISIGKVAKLKLSNWPLLFFIFAFTRMRFYATIYHE
jgi:hypothetical protein